MFRYNLALLKRLKADRKGITSLEYGVMAAIIVVGLSLAVPGLVTALNANWTNIEGILTPAA